MPNIEFIYERSCPNIGATRERLKQVLASSGLPMQWREWEQHDPNCPDHALRYGSPTILVDGVDIAGETPSEAPSCRLYLDSRGQRSGVPDSALITAALQRSDPQRGTRPSASLLQHSSLLPAVGAALLPKLTCPACWPAYAALLSALGVGFIDYTPWLLPLTLVFLVITLAILARRPRHGPGPLGLGVVAAIILLIGKFYFDSELATAAAVLLLVVASVWNAWPATRCGTTR